jgi:hypothetical protein
MRSGLGLESYEASEQAAPGSRHLLVAALANWLRCSSWAELTAAYLDRIEAIAASHHSARVVEPEVAYATDLGTMYHCDVETFLASGVARAVRDEVQMVFTSPPFPLNRNKKYGNRKGEEYLEWLGELAQPLGDLLAADGSLVVELGNAWEPGEPVMSTLALRALLTLLERGGFHLCQQFVVHNPARLPSPIQWVNKERIRVKDAYTNVWWMSRVTRPKANNRNVLAEYSPSMKKLLLRQSYNAGKRPSEHTIGKASFLADHGGAIPSNVLRISNTATSDRYRRYCKEAGLRMHPARMAPTLAEFFVRFLTDEGDLVLDCFGGSNTTGAVAEDLGRRWLAIEPEADYIAGSREDRTTYLSQHAGPDPCAVGGGDQAGLRRPSSNRQSPANSQRLLSLCRRRIVETQRRLGRRCIRLGLGFSSGCEPGFDLERLLMAFGP